MYYFSWFITQAICNTALILLQNKPLGTWNSLMQRIWISKIHYAGFCRLVTNIHNTKLKIASLFETCNYKHHSIVLGYITIKLFFFETFHIYSIRI